MKVINRVTIVILVLLLAASVKECNRHRVQSEETLKSVMSYRDKSQPFKTDVGLNGQVSATQNQAIVSDSKELQRLLKENSDLKKVNQQIAIEADIKIRDVIATYSNVKVEEAFIYDTVEVDKVVPVGVKFGTKYNLTDEWYSVAGSVQPTGVHIDSLTFRTDTYVNIGYTRDKWYKRLEPKVEVVEKNPHTTVNSLNNLTVKDHKKWHQRPILYFLIGSATTAILILK